jgi:hypothetical protein
MLIISLDLSAMRRDVSKKKITEFRIGPYNSLNITVTPTSCLTALFYDYTTSMKIDPVSH